MMICRRCRKTLTEDRYRWLLPSDRFCLECAPTKTPKNLPIGKLQLFDFPLKWTSIVVFFFVCIASIVYHAPNSDHRDEKRQNATTTVAPPTPSEPHQELSEALAKLNYQVVSVATMPALGHYAINISKKIPLGELATSNDSWLTTLWVGAFGYGFAYSGIIKGNNPSPVSWRWGLGKLYKSLETERQNEALLSLRGGGGLTPNLVEFQGFGENQIEKVIVRFFAQEESRQKIDQYGHELPTTDIHTNAQECVLSRGNAGRFNWSNFSIGEGVATESDKDQYQSGFPTGAVIDEAVQAIACYETSKPGGEK